MSTAAPDLPTEPMTVDAFLAWAERHPGRYELHDGVIVRMAAERLSHIRVKLRAWMALHQALKSSVKTCEAIGDGASVRITDHIAFEPDALVYCGDVAEGSLLAVDKPVVVVEVVSPSTGSTDATTKYDGYFSLPSVRHYLIINPESRLVLHHHRLEDERVMTAIAREGERLSLDPPGIAFDIAELFADLPQTG